MSSAPKNLKTYSKKVDPAPGIGPDPLTVFNGWAEHILNLVENHDVFIDGHRELVDEMSSGTILRDIMLNYSEEEYLPLVCTFVDLGAQYGTTDVDEYYWRLRDWVADRNEGDHQNTMGTIDEDEGNVEDITLSVSPMYEDDLTVPPLPDSSPMRPQVPTRSGLRTPERQDSVGRLSPLERNQSVPRERSSGPREGGSSSIPGLSFGAGGQSTGARASTPIRHQAGTATAMLSPLKEMEEPTENDEGDPVPTVKTDMDTDREEEEDNGVQGDGPSKQHESSSSSEESSSEEEEDGEKRDELEETEPSGRGGAGRARSVDERDSDSESESESEPEPVPEKKKKTTIQYIGKKRKADEMEPETQTTRSGRVVRVIKSAQFVHSDEDDEYSPSQSRTRPLSPRGSRSQQLPAASTSRQRGNGDPRQTGLADRPCGRCARTNRPCRIWVNKPAAKACATCNAKHVRCDFVSSVPRRRQSRTTSRLPSRSRSRSPKRKSSKNRHRHHSTDDEDEEKPDPYSPEELAKRRAGKARAHSTSHDMKRSTSEHPRPGKRVKIEDPREYDARDSYRRRGNSSNPVSDTRVDSLAREIERLEVGMQSDNKWFTQSIDRLDKRVNAVEDEQAIIRENITSLEKLQGKNSEQLGEFLGSMKTFVGKIDSFLDTTRRRVEDLESQDRQTQARLDDIPNYITSAITNSRSANPTYTPAQLQQSARYSFGDNVASGSSYRHNHMPERPYQPLVHHPSLNVRAGTSWGAGQEDDLRGPLQDRSIRRGRPDIHGPARPIAGPTIVGAETSHTARHTLDVPEFDPYLELEDQFFNVDSHGPAVAEGPSNHPARQLSEVPHLTVQPPSQSTADTGSPPSSPGGFLDPPSVRPSRETLTAEDSEQRMRMLARVAGESVPLVNIASSSGSSSPLELPDDNVRDQAGDATVVPNVGPAVGPAPTTIPDATNPDAPNPIPIDNSARLTTGRSRTSSRARSPAPSSSSVLTRSASRSREASLQPVGRRTRSASVTSTNGASGRG